MGTGSFEYTISKEKYVTAIGTFDVTDENLGDVVELVVELEKTGADYTALETKIIEAKDVTGKYTATSYEALQNAITAAENVSDTLKFDEQGVIDALVSDIEAALNALVPVKSVSFIAVAVADDANVDYAKATKIVMVFAEPIEAGADILENISIKDAVEAASWIDADNTTYELVLKKDANLVNGTEIVYTANDAVKTELGYVLDNASAITAGNLEDVSDEVTATNMAATIVKMSDTPSVAAGDKIVVVFNAPVKGNPATIEINEMTAEVMADSGNTVYVITLDGSENIDNNTKLEYGTITDVPLNGSFGEAVAPKALHALAVDNDGTAKTEGDNIIVVFDRPTNGVEPGSGELENVVSGVEGVTLGTESSAVWEENDTKLFITLGSDAVVTNGIVIDLSQLGIMDRHALIDADIAPLVIDGSFGTVTAPVINGAYAVDNDGEATIAGDMIVITFDQPTNGATIDLNKEGFVVNQSTTFGNSSFEWQDSNTKLVITLGSTADIKTGIKLDFSNQGIMDKDGIVAAVANEIAVEGSFGSSLNPKITRAIAFTQNNKHVIRVFFNTEVEWKEYSTYDVYIEGGYNFDSAVEKWTHNGISYYDVILSEHHDELPDKAIIKFEGTLVDSKTKNMELVDATAEISGGFEKDIDMEILSLTAYSKDGSGIAKTGDRIVLVTNSAATEVKSTLGEFTKEDDITWVYTLEDKDLGVNVGDSLIFDIKSATNGKTYDNMQANIGGSFGYMVEPKLMSATAYSKDGSGIAKKGDEIIFTFDSPVTGLTSSLGAVSSSDNMTWVITLSTDNAVEIGQKLDITVNSVATDIEYSFAAVLTGSFGQLVEPDVISATVYSKEGSGVAQLGDEIIVVFNTPVSDVTTEAGNAVTTDNIIWTVALTDTNIKIGDAIRFKGTSIATGYVFDLSAKLAGSFGYKAEAKLLSATVYSNDGSGVAKAGDKIVIVFNMPVEGVTSKIGDVTASADKSVWTITLAKDNSIKIGDELKFENVYDLVTDTKYNFTTTLEGGFGYKVEPKLLSLTAYSNDGSGVAKKGDKIVAVFDSAVYGITSTLGTAVTEDNMVWTITLGENHSVTVGTNLSFVVTTAEGSNDAYHLTKELGGSFGMITVPEITSVTAISNDGSGVAKKGDRIVVVFNTAVRVGSENASETYVYTYKLTETDVSEGAYETGNEYSVDVWSVATGKGPYTCKAVIGGSYGYSEEPQVKSVVLSENDGVETITVVFDGAIDVRENNVNMNMLCGDNGHLDATGAKWENSYTLKITLGENAKTTDGNVLNLSNLGIKAAATGNSVSGLENLEIQGNLVSIVTKLEFAGESIVIDFSARTNGKADISKLTSLLGIGAKAEWSDNNKKLTITLGENYTISNDGFIVLNDMGIYDGFAEKYQVVGQYQVNGSPNSDILTLAKIVAQSKDKSTSVAQAGDTILVKFNNQTNLGGCAFNVEISSADVEKFITVEGGNEAAFGEGYTGTWIEYDTLVITLGTSPSIKAGDEIVVKGISFANGNGEMEETVEKLGGSFNGREFVLTNAKLEIIDSSGKSATKGDYRISLTAENTLLNPDVKPTFVCVAYNGKSAVGIMRITVDVESTIQPTFEFPGAYGVTSAKIYVFDDAFANISESPGVLAETIEAKQDEKK